MATGLGASKAIGAWLGRFSAWRKSMRREDSHQTPESELRSYWMSQFQPSSHQLLAVKPGTPRALLTLKPEEGREPHQAPPSTSQIPGGR